jgi:hypothetical protein
MTPSEIDTDREEFSRALADPRHPWHQGAHDLINIYHLGDDKIKRFIKAIAPYAFPADADKA